jgi:hypothetical protein
MTLPYINNQTGARNKFSVDKINKEFPAFCGTWMFSILFTKSRHWTPSCVTWSHFTPATSHLWPTFILLSHLCRGSPNRFSLPDLKFIWMHCITLRMQIYVHSITKEPCSFPQVFHTSAKRTKLSKTYLHISNQWATTDNSLLQWQWVLSWYKCSLIFMLYMLSTLSLPLVVTHSCPESFSVFLHNYFLS